MRRSSLGFQFSFYCGSAVLVIDPLYFHSNPNTLSGTRFGNQGLTRLPLVIQSRDQHFFVPVLRDTRVTRVKNGRVKSNRNVSKKEDSERRDECAGIKPPNDLMITHTQPRRGGEDSKETYMKDLIQYLAAPNPTHAHTRAHTHTHTLRYVCVMHNTMPRLQFFSAALQSIGITSKSTIKGRLPSPPLHLQLCSPELHPIQPSG